MNILLGDSFSISPQGALIIWGVTLLIFLIIVVVLSKRLSDSIKAANENNGMINQYFAATPADRIGIINAIYQNTKKDLGMAMLLSIVGGTFGFQRLYLGKRKSALAMFLFFWTGIPTIISIFDLTAMPKTVSDFNLAVIKSLFDQLSAPEIGN